MANELEQLMGAITVTHLDALKNQNSRDEFKEIFDKRHKGTGITCKNKDGESNYFLSGLSFNNIGPSYKLGFVEGVERAPKHILIHKDEKGYSIKGISDEKITLIPGQDKLINKLFQYNN